MEMAAVNKNEYFEVIHSVDPGVKSGFMVNILEPKQSLILSTKLPASGKCCVCNVTCEEKVCPTHYKTNVEGDPCYVCAHMYSRRFRTFQAFCDFIRNDCDIFDDCCAEKCEWVASNLIDALLAQIATEEQDDDEFYDAMEKEAALTEVTAEPKSSEEVAAEPKSDAEVSTEPKTIGEGVTGYPTRNKIQEVQPPSTSGAEVSLAGGENTSTTCVEADCNEFQAEAGPAMAAKNAAAGAARRRRTRNRQGGQSSSQHNAFGFKNTYTETNESRIQGKVGTFAYDPEKRGSEYFLAKIPLSNRHVPRAKLMFKQFQKFRNAHVTYKVSSAWGNLQGGTVRWGVVMDPSDDPVSYDQMLNMISSSPVNGINKVIESWSIKIPSHIFRSQTNDSLFTSPGSNPRLSEYGFLYFVMEADPKDAGSFSVDVDAMVHFSIPSMEKESIVHSGVTPMSLMTIKETPAVYPENLLHLSELTNDQLIAKWPELPSEGGIMRLRGLGQFSVTAGSGNSENIGYEYVIYVPSGENGQLLFPVILGGDLSFEILTDKSDHGSRGNHYQASLVKGTPYEFVAATLDELNAQSGNLTMTTVVTPKGVKTVRQNRVTLSLPVDEHDGRNGPLPPVTPTVQIDPEQVTELEDEIGERVAKEHETTRGVLSGENTELEEQVGGVYALIGAEHSATRETVRLRTDVVLGEVASTSAVQIGEIAKTVSNTNSLVVDVRAMKSDIATVGTTTQTDASHNRSEHAKIISLIEAMPKINNHGLIKQHLLNASQSFGVDTEAFALAFNTVLAAFGLPAVVPMSFDLLIAVDDLVTYLYQGHLFAYQSGGDLPGTNGDYNWPSFGSIAADPDSVVGLYFRTQPSGSDLVNAPVYQYFRVAGVDGSNLQCTKHTAGDPPLPLP